MLQKATKSTWKTFLSKKSDLYILVPFPPIPKKKSTKFAIIFFFNSLRKTRKIHPRYVPLYTLVSHFVTEIENIKTLHFGSQNPRPINYYL